ncbi:recombinase family protein, partial [Listeria monocytogenes]|nr:recombinase family protein [Listeria monocytogenes]
MKAAIYIRVSTQEQIENYSIQAQTEKLTALCRSKDWDVYDIFIDGGYSGSNMNRPALNEMLSKLHEIDAVVVYRLDRLSRSQRDTITLIEEYFLKNNVEFVSLSETLDTSSPFGRAMIGILSVFAQLERETIRDRMVM